MTNPKKIVKLAIIRDDESTGCPFLLSPIPKVCQVAGESVDHMLAIDHLPINLSKKEIEGIRRKNIDVLKQRADGTKCKYAVHLFAPKIKAVDCDYGDTAAGAGADVPFAGSPYYSQLFNGIGMDGLYNYPLGAYWDGTMSHNLYYGVNEYASDRIEKLEKRAQLWTAFNKIAVMGLVNSREHAAHILGVSPFATPEEINKAYRLEAANVHPDLNPDVDPNEMKTLNAARDFLLANQSELDAATEEDQVEEEVSYEDIAKKRQEMGRDEFRHKYPGWEGELMHEMGLDEYNRIFEQYDPEETNSPENEEAREQAWHNAKDSLKDQYYEYLSTEIESIEKDFESGDTNGFNSADEFVLAILEDWYKNISPPEKLDVEIDQYCGKYFKGMFDAKYLKILKTDAWRDVLSGQIRDCKRNSEQSNKRASLWKKLSIDRKL